MAMFIAVRKIIAYGNDYFFLSKTIVEENNIYF